MSAGWFLGLAGFNLPCLAVTSSPPRAAKSNRRAISGAILTVGFLTTFSFLSRPGPAATGDGQVSTARNALPVVTVLRPPDFWGSYAIWGATGADRAGHIFLGLTSNDDRGSGSAHLFEFDAVTSTFSDRGNVVAELERLGLRRPGETQMKIHSRIVQAADGYQYFSSMDESGEAEDGSRLPQWGGHLWRRGANGRWEHLAATPEALIAVAAGGPFVYSLGYFNHVLYQFDTRTRRLRSVAVGSVGGHISRNFWADDRGHAFVPRVARQAATSASASLVEFDEQLKEVGQRPLGEYFEKSPNDSHGIVGIASDGNHGWYFTTGKGRLYRETPSQTDLFTLEDLGWMHPAGPRYPASLFRDDRSGTLYAVAMPSNYGGTAFDWITRTADGRTTVAPFPYGDAPQFPSGALVYGSMTRDAQGRFYVVGTMSYKPVVLQVGVSQ